ncbi:hypothetical protein EXIGLDRAFT_847318 [Exidia glandulosa HHB12029]|uniref:Uncharacterized protein n=1 Tax=Exidia glandulosa HHB12029 TaxID=1314781 RepID=A0A165Z1V1_EXIGL|nr:hypothetical protein EXIGLDRAFT_847318 [Exidia glandulosa HHB12029]
MSFARPMMERCLRDREEGEVEMEEAEVEEGEVDAPSSLARRHHEQKEYSDSPTPTPVPAPPPAVHPRFRVLGDRSRSPSVALPNPPLSQVRDAVRRDPSQPLPVPLPLPPMIVAAEPQPRVSVTLPWRFSSPRQNVVIPPVPVQVPVPQFILDRR